MDNFSPAQYDRFEAYRRHALPKQAVRRVSLAIIAYAFLRRMMGLVYQKVIQQTTGQQVSQPVAQIVAGFGKVFVGEIVEKGKVFASPNRHLFNSFVLILSTARAVQARRSETGPLSPDHLREAYRLYQAETGRVGSARAGRGRKLFVR